MCIAVDDVPQPVGCLAVETAVLRLLTSPTLPQDAELPAGVAPVRFEHDSLNSLSASWDIGRDMTCVPLILVWHKIPRPLQDTGPEMGVNGYADDAECCVGTVIESS